MSKKVSTASLYTYRATVRSVYDGDTFRADLHLGMGIIFMGEAGSGASLRLLGCNAIELGKPGGLETKANLESLLPVGAVVTLRTVKPDKFGGRYNAQITLPDGRDLVTLLIAQGYAMSYTGEGTKHTPAFPIVVPAA